MRVPNNAFPIPPVATVEDLSNLANKLYWKLGQQAERQKTITAVTGGGSNSEADAQRIVAAKDGQAIRVDSPGAVQEVKMGGPTQEVGVMNDDVLKKFNYLAGNPDLLSGTAKPSPTLGQDQIFTEASSQLLASMQDQVYKFARGILEDMAFYNIEDPDPSHNIFDEPLKGLIVPVEITKQDLKGSFMDYTFEVVPYSMSHMTPGQRITAVQQFLQAYAPFAQMAMQQGVTLDFEKLAEIWAQNRNLPELRDLFNINSAFTSDLRSVASGSDGGMPKVKAPTNSTYTRISESGGRQSPLTMNEVAGGGQGLSGLGAPTQGA
jgi:hypothetical protein